MTSRFGIRSDRVLVHNSSKPGLLVVEDGLIVDLLDRDAPLDSPVQDVGNQVLMPALVDTNVHIGDPGRAHWEAFSTATAAAAAGGVSVIIDMPHTSIPPVVTTTAVAHKHSATAGVIRVDVGFWGGLVPGNLVEARQMADAGVFGFATFLGPSEFDAFPSLGVDLLEGLCAQLTRSRAPCSSAPICRPETRRPPPTRSSSKHTRPRPGSKGWPR